MQPKQIFKAFIYALATVGGLGYIPKGPGTFGSLAGLLAFICVAPNCGWVYYTLLVLAVCVCVPICTCAERYMQEKDPSRVVLDEFVAMPFCFLGLESREIIWIWILGFLVFRILDIVKPFGIKHLQSFGGGLGIVIDDIAAALITSLILNVMFMLI